jgi:uncharacterized membrane protein
MRRIRIYLRNSFLAGILATLPLFVTFLFLRFVFVKFSGFLLPYFDLLVVRYDIVIPRYLIEIFSFLVIVFAILMIGFVAKNYVGRKILLMLETIVSKIPFVKSVYGMMRQIVDTFQTTSGNNFKQVVLVEYPRKGIFSLGFVTKDASDFFTGATGKDCLSVFIPTTPNPTSGFILIVPKDELQILNIPVEEGVKYVISAGLIEPFDKSGNTVRKNVS